MEIPDSVFDLYNEVVTQMTTDWFGVSSTLFYPVVKARCDNCLLNSLTGTSQNIYNGTGPIPFSDTTCPRCFAEGFVEVSSETEDIYLRVYPEKKNWLKIQTEQKLSDGAVQVYGLIDDYPKLKRAERVLINSKQGTNYAKTYVLSGEPTFHGFKKNKFFIAHLELSNG